MNRYLLLVRDREKHIQYYYDLAKECIVKAEHPVGGAPGFPWGHM